MIACPYCQSAIAEVPQLAGQLVACPACSGTFPLPPPVQFQRAVAPKPAAVQMTPSRMASRARGNARRVVRILMLIATGLWVVGVLAIGPATFLSTVNDPDLVWNNAGRIVYLR